MASKFEDQFSMNFMLPEHVEVLIQMKEDQKHVEKPVLEDDELTEFCYLITDSRQYDYEVNVSWRKSTKGDRGVIETAWGWVDKFDQVLQ
ncbi:YolD-like family protein [Brevibacillus daliensis]|uniref:YolD-like family protein n=1 Tax=Brevibacillus daliensis TaxID=2892995 RepID=UPI0028161D9E|nr:YolD-like family protein [Brevibacillus daliensis]